MAGIENHDSGDLARMKNRGAASLRREKYVCRPIAIGFRCFDVRIKDRGERIRSLS